MNPNEKFKLVDGALETIYDYQLLGLTREECFPSMAAEIEDLLELNSNATLKGRRDFFNIPFTKDADYREELFDINGKNALLGIRHTNGISSLPFVHSILAFSPSRDDISILKRIAKERFEVFSPKHLSIWLKASKTSDVDADFIARHYVAGRISNLLLRQPVIPKNIKLIKKSAIDEDWYQAAYSEFHLNSPELKNWVPKTSIRELNENASDGLLFEIQINDQTAGIISASRDSILNQKSVYMTEFLLTSKFRGKGYATSIQKVFLKMVDKEASFMWGTIDARNLPSLKTALAIGRIPVRSEIFVSLDSYQSQRAH